MSELLYHQQEWMIDQMAMNFQLEQFFGLMAQSRNGII